MTNHRRGSVAEVVSGAAAYGLHHGCCLPWLDAIYEAHGACADALITDLPYAEIDRDYGRMSEPEWEEFAHGVVRKGLRVLKPSGSAVFIIQPNSKRVGRMRAWAFRFMAWCADDLERETGGRIGIVQDAWWWNIAAAPTVHCRRENGLMRTSLKPTVWVGPEDCYRSQESVLWSESERNAALRTAARTGVEKRPSGQSFNLAAVSAAAIERGGVTPFNVLPVANTNSSNSAGAHGHGAGTPYDVASWWVRYLCPKGGLVIDSCGGDMTVGVAARRWGARFLGCEKMAKHYRSGELNMMSCDIDTSGTVAAGDDPDFGELFARAKPR